LEFTAIRKMRRYDAFGTTRCEIMSGDEDAVLCWNGLPGSIQLLLLADAKVFVLDAMILRWRDWLVASSLLKEKHLACLCFKRASKNLPFFPPM